MKVCIYARVSTQDQNVDQMADFCKEYAKNKGWEVVWTIKDKESGRKELFERTQFKKIINTINGSAPANDRYNFLDDCDAILISKVDRLSRNWYDENEIEKAFVDNPLNINLFSAFETIDMKTSEGLFMFRFYFMLACKEVETMLERQAIGIARAKKEGKYKGRKKGAVGLKKSFSKEVVGKFWKEGV